MAGLRNRLACAFFAVALGGAAQDRAPVALEAAIHKEVVDGDLEGAIRQYDLIARGPNRVTAAQALVRMARCYEKLGDGRATPAYERVLSQFAEQKDAAREARERLAALALRQAKSGIVVGWYNGDWQTGIPGPANWYRAPGEFSRVYDDFAVPAGGWTVAGAFSDNWMDASQVHKASWEIRAGMSDGNGGKLVASGVSAATVAPLSDPRLGRDAPIASYRVEVDGLRVRLPAGTYWVSVAPARQGQSFAHATLGKNATGNPAGNNGRALVYSPLFSFGFREAETVGSRGQLGIAKDFSQGVLIFQIAK